MAWKRCIDGRGLSAPSEGAGQSSEHNAVPWCGWAPVTTCSRGAWHAREDMPKFSCCWRLQAALYVVPAPRGCPQERGAVHGLHVACAPLRLLVQRIRKMRWFIGKMAGIEFIGNTMRLEIAKSSMARIPIGDEEAIDATCRR